MPNYIRITSRGRHNVRVLLQDGTTRVLSVEDFNNNWTQVDVAPTFEYDFRHFVNPPNPEDRVYIRVLRRARFNTTVSLPNGATIKIPNEYFHTWTQGRDTSDIPLCGIYNRTEPEHNNTIEETQEENNCSSLNEEQPVRRRRGRPRRDGSDTPRGYQQPEDQSNRIYVSIVRRGSRNTSVLTPDGERVSVPNEYLDSWLRVGTSAYYTWDERNTYPNGRTIEHLTFGVELEFIADRSKLEDFCEAMRSLVGEDRFTCPLHYGLSSTTKWALCVDSSVQSTINRTRNKSGYELTSPILKFDNTSKRELKEVLRIITSVFDGEVNKTCGTHIHIGNFANRQGSNIYSNANGFRNLYGDLESSVFDKLVSPSRRLNNNRYCLSCYQSTDYTRYMKINTRKLDSLGTLENRQHQGTLELTKIWDWMELNGKFIVSYFNNPSLFDSFDHSMLSFFSLIGLSQEATTFFIDRANILSRNTST